MNLKFLISKGLRKLLSPPAIRDSKLDKTVAVWNDSSINNAEIGKYTYISDHTVISYAEIGAFCSIAAFCMIGGAGHPVQYATTSPVFLTGRNALKQHFAQVEYEPYQKTVIGNDVWIGTHCTIRSGVRIGDGAVIGMGSVVTKDVGPYEIWGGNPAHFIRNRFPEEIKEKMLESKWWELRDDMLRKVGHTVNRPEEFLQLVESVKKEQRG